MNFSEEDYLLEDWFRDEESGVPMCYATSKMVTVRKEHICWLSLVEGRVQHNIAIGKRACFKKALIDKSFWGKFYMCTDCMDELLTIYYSEEEDET